VVKFLGLKMTEEEVQALFDEFDEDKSGSIEFDEFLILISKKANQYLLYLLDNIKKNSNSLLLHTWHC
jgi:Ca2+-binding EF-hand superfamily protein